MTPPIHAGSAGPKPGVPWLRPELVAPWREIIAVITVVIGYSTLISGMQAWNGSSHTYMSKLLTDQHLAHTVLIESAILGLLFVHLHRRGWKFSDFKIKPDWSNTGIGLLVAPSMMIVNMIIVATGFLILYVIEKPPTLAAFIHSNSPHLVRHSMHLSWVVGIFTMIFNGYFEEITCMGYVFTQLATKRGPLFALIVTVMLRMSCHTYQGLIHMLGIGAGFLVFGLVYWWRRNLWPLIFAHIIVDSVSVVTIKLLFG